MSLKPGWLHRFADLIEEHDAHIPFKSLHRADLLLRGDTVADLARAGGQTVWIGAESGSQTVLDAMEKGTKVEQIYQAAEKLHSHGIEVGFFLQFGYPGETRSDIRRTFRMIRDCRPDDIGMSVSYPLPGTKFYATVRDQLGVKQNWTDSNDLAMLYRGPFSTAFYRQLHAVLHTEFRARKAWDELRSLLFHRRQVRRPTITHTLKPFLALTTLPWRRLRLEWLALNSTRHDRTSVDRVTAIGPAPQTE